MGDHNNINNLSFFKDKSFCLDFPTSTSPLKKNQYAQLIKDAGGKIDFSITSKTNYYITFQSNIDNPSFRSKSAIKLNVAILLDTFIYDIYNNSINCSKNKDNNGGDSIEFIDYLFIDGIRANESLISNIENSISQSNITLNHILSTLNYQNTTTTTTTVTNTTTPATTASVEIEDNEDTVSYTSNESFGSMFDLFKSNTSSMNDYTYRPYTAATTFVEAEEVEEEQVKPTKPLSRFEQLLLIKKENTEKRKLEQQRLQDEKLSQKNELLEQKRKEKQDKLDQLQKEKEVKIEYEKERRKQVLEKTKTLSVAELIKLTKPTSSSTSSLNKNGKTNNKNNKNKKLESSSYGLKIDHQGIKIRKEQEKADKLKKQEMELELKKQEKLERTRLFNLNKSETERIEKEEKARLDKENLEAFQKRQKKRMAKEIERLKQLELLESNGGVMPEPEPAVIAVDEDLRKLFVGGINCDDLDEKTKKDSKKLLKIKERRISYLMKLFDNQNAFGTIQKRSVNLDKGLFFITFVNVESCAKAVTHFSTNANKKAAIDQITLLPKKSPLHNPNKNFYVRIVKANEKAKKKEYFDKSKTENLKSSAKQQLQKDEDAEFADWDVAK